MKNSIVRNFIAKEIFLHLKKQFAVSNNFESSKQSKLSYFNYDKMKIHFGNDFTCAMQKIFCHATLMQVAIVQKQFTLQLIRTLLPHAAGATFQNMEI